MKIRTNGKAYDCDGFRDSGGLRYRVAEEPELGAEIVLETDGGMELRRDTVESWARSYWADGVLVLTNEPEPVPVEDTGQVEQPEPVPTAIEQIAQLQARADDTDAALMELAAMIGGETSG